MTWRMEVPYDFAGEGNKIKYRALPYVRGLGLDIACGPWRVFPHSIGLDGTPIDGPCNTGPNLIMDCRYLGLFTDGMFDYIFSSHFLEHVVETEAVLKEWWRKIKVGGYLILYLPHKKHYPNCGQPGANPDHKHDFLPEDIVKVMKRVGGWALHENEDRSADYEYSFFQVYRKRADGQHIDLTDKPKPAKTAALVRSGNFGDALWAGSVAAKLKDEGYHVTCYVGPLGEAVLEHDPNIDRLIVLDDQALPPTEWGKLFQAEKPRYDKWVNFIHSAEIELLKTADQLSFFWPDAVRRDACNRNYVEFMHQIADVPYDLGVRFYPTDAELQWAREQRAEFDGRLVVLCNGGSTAPKWWPYAPAFVALLAELGIRTVVLGDLKGLSYPAHPLVHVMGTEKWTIRQSMVFAGLASAVIGQETGILNALALEAVPKVVMLSHSSVTNLTRDWASTVSLHGDVPCYPCHRIHYTHQFCPQDETTKAAKCQAAITIEQAMDALRDLGVLTAGDLAKLGAPTASETRIEETA